MEIFKYFLFLLTSPIFTLASLKDKITNYPLAAAVGSKAQCICGKTGASKQKIVGGKVADNHIYPWIAALVYLGGSKPTQFCGSSLINDRYVLTASHCVSGKSASLSSYQVSLGSNKVNGTDAKRYNILGILMHPQYDPNTLDNDIALIKLTEVVKMTPKIRPVCLAQGQSAFVGKQANVAGWGTQQKGGNGVNKLRETTVKVMQNTVCAKNYSNTNSVKITPNMVCASYPGRDSCSGDSGGPLVIKEGSEVYRQIGIVSFGIDCGNTHYPGVYTRVTKYLKWIHDNTKDGRYCSK